MRRRLGIACAIITIGNPFLVLADDHQDKRSDTLTRASLGETKDQSSFRALITNASEAYGAIVKGSHGEVPGAVLRSALCVAVLPGVMTGALVVGGTHGEGLVSCKTAQGKWSQPATISLNEGSIGLQAGISSADMVLFFQNNKAVQALKSGKVTVGGDISAVAGSYDSSVKSADAGVVAYSRAAGLFAGLSVNGSSIGKAQDMLERYYGTKIDYTALLEGRQSPDSMGYTDTFTRLLP